MRAWLIAVVVGLTAGLVGPRLVGASSHAAGEPFTYVPPDGFVETTPTSKTVDTAGARAWQSKTDYADEMPPALVVVHHSSMEMQVDEPSLAKMVADMPKAFEDAGCTWVHRRHETRKRPDGALVGLIEGDCDTTLDLSALGVPKTVKSRRLQLVFPDDTGTSIATISFPTEQASRWEPTFEATIDRAKGVATRMPSPPLWQHVAWGLAALVLTGLAASAIRLRRQQQAS